MLQVIYLSILLLATSLGIFSCFKNKIDDNITYLTYSFLGLIFEIIFRFSNNHRIEYLFDLIFPICITVSIIKRHFSNANKFILLCLFFTTFLYFFVEIKFFKFFNYSQSIIWILIYLICKSRNKFLKWSNSIDILIAINLYFMYLAFFVSQKILSWQESIYISFYHSIVMFLLILTLILINVKFWRSLTN